MRWTILSTAMLSALAATSRAAPDDAEVAKACAELEAIVRHESPDLHRDGGPSLTSLVRTLLARDPVVVRRAENDLWAASKRGDLFASESAIDIETAIRFLHDMGGVPESFTWLAVVAGDVVAPDCWGFYSGPGPTPFPGTLDELVTGRPLRVAPRMDPAALLSADAPETSSKLIESQQIEFATALGEACAKDDASFRELMKRATKPDEFHALALGWTRRAEAAAFLERRLRALLAEAPLPTIDRGFGSLAAAAVALRYADSAAFERLVAALPAEQGDCVAAQVGGATLVRRLLATIDGATDAASKRAATLRVCRVVSAFNDRVHGTDVGRLLRALLSAARGDDAEVKDATLRAASDALHAAPSRSEARRAGSSSRSEGGAERHVWVGRPGSDDELLRAVVDDLDAGRLAFIDAPPGLLEPRPATPWSASACARTEVVLDAKDPRYVAPPVPAHVSVERTPDGLRLRIRNVGTTPLAVDPVGLRYGDVQDVTVTIPSDGGPRRSERRLWIEFGGVRSTCVTPSRCLSYLAPGAAYEWTVRLREELRGFDHVEIELPPSTRVVGAASAPLLCFDRTPVL